MGNGISLTAFLITRFPTKKLYMTGITGFIVGLLFSIFSGNFGLMMVGRVLQACGNGVLVSVAQVIILTVYPAEKKGTMMGTYGLATTAAPIIAPTVAGLMIDAFGWKSIFYLVLVIMIASFVISAVVFGDILEIQDKKFDIISFVESIFAFRTIAGSIGSAVFVGIMTVVSAGSVADYGDNALMHGMNMSFFWMAVGSLVLIMISILGTRNNAAIPEK